MQPAVPEVLRPTLAYPLQILESRTALTLETAAETITIKGIDPSLGAKLIEHLNNGTDAGVSSNIAAEKLLGLLLDEKLVVAGEPDYYTGIQIAQLLQRYFPDWNEDLFGHLLWVSLAAGSAKHSVVDGWLIETYHFIKGANARLAYAISQTTDASIRSIFVHHYIEEYDHYKFFAESLERRGISVDDVERLGPLPTTTAVINMARRAARLDHLAYAACSGLLESTGTDAKRAREFYQELARHYDSGNTGFVEPMLAHVALDEAYEHGSVMQDIFRGAKVVSSERAARIIECASIFKDTLLLWFSDILRHYHLRPFDPNRTHRNFRQSG
jgi:hypothetical protein